MEKQIRQKAIEQAQASLNIDRIQLSEDFINSYFNKYQIPLPPVKKLICKRGNNNGKHSQ